MAAYRRAEQLLFQTITRLGRIEDCDTFLYIYPHSPLAPVVAKYATEKAIQQERKVAATLQSDPAKVAQRISFIISQVWFPTKQKVQRSPQEPLYLYQAQRLVEVLRTVYPNSPLVAQFLTQQASTQEIKEAIGQLQKSMERNFEQLRQVIRQEFEKTRQTFMPPSRWSPVVIRCRTG